MTPKTFKELGLTFEFDTNCLTCNEGNCHNIVNSTKNNIEYSVHISTDREFSFFRIYATESSNTDSDLNIEQYFTEEIKAVEFINVEFNGFKCF